MAALWVWLFAPSLHLFYLRFFIFLHIVIYVIIVVIISLFKLKLLKVINYSVISSQSCKNINNNNQFSILHEFYVCKNSFPFYAKISGKNSKLEIPV